MGHGIGGALKNLKKVCYTDGWSVFRRVLIIPMKRDEICFCHLKFSKLAWSLLFLELLHYFRFSEDYVLQRYVLVPRFIARLGFADSIQHFCA